MNEVKGGTNNNLLQLKLFGMSSLFILNCFTWYIFVFSNDYCVKHIIQL